MPDNLLKHLSQTTAGYLLIFQLEQDVKADKGVTLYEYQQNKTLQGENNDGVPALRLCWKTTIEYSAPIVRYHALSVYHDRLLKKKSVHCVCFFAAFRVSVKIC